jgi:ABC-type bacteriocin/lantibiotic exporter with double-glycine peptidase domain
MNLSSGDLFGISLYLQRFVDPLNSIVQYYFTYEEVKVTFLKLSDIIPDSGSTYDERHSLRLKGRIRFERVSFRYTQDGPWVVRDVSFSIFPGQIVGIVGKSGSGKTTLASLIAGNLQPTTGRIFYDDFERSFISDESFLSQIGFIEQNNQLYAGSIKSNIAYNDDVPNLDMLDKSIDLSYSKEFISRFPQELDTYLAEGGLGLSGGQKQRLCIARTIYSDPKIMLFDEATSALDSESEKAISDNLRLILKGRTAFIIAHRLGTIRNADVILVVEQGKLVQTGNHDQLIKAEGIYRELFIEQSSS